MQEQPNLGRRIKFLRHVKDWTQKDLAKQIGHDRQTVSNYENGKTTPSKYDMQRLADVLGVTVEELEKGER